MTDQVTLEVTLLPCPFCGSNAIAWRNKDRTAVSHVFCSDSVSCGATLELHELTQDAITAWNSRTPSPTTRVLVEALEKIIASNQERSWTETVGFPDSVWVISDGQYAKIARHALSLARNVETGKGK